MKVLITGFGPFPGVPRNPAGQAAIRLARLRRPALTGLQRTALVLPTEWSSLDLLEDAISRLRPDAVFMLGVASRRRRFAIEARAVNAARGLDAARHRPPRRLAAAGPSALNLKGNAPSLVHGLKAAGLAACLSRDAGRYLCNGAYYTALATTPAGVPVVFVHLPGRGPQARRPTRQVDFALSQAMLALLRLR